MYWIVGLLTGQAISFVSVYLFTFSADASNFSAFSLWFLVLALEATFIFSFAVFLLSIKRKFVSTFFTTMTAKQFNAQRFRETTSDLGRFAILHMHPSYMEGPLREEVKIWVAENWNTWNYDKKPEWFTPWRKSQIPLDMWPLEDSEVSKKKKMSLAESRRKSSALIVIDAINEARRNFLDDAT